MDDEDFLAAVEADNAITPVADEPKVETPPEPTVEVKVETPAVTVETPEPVLELTELAPEQTKPTEGFVPIGAVLDERDKRKALEAELAQLRAKPAPIQMPDPYEDPEGYAAAQQAQVGGALYQINLRYSERLANVEHGAETVTAAKEWGFAKCETDPYFNAKVAASEDPIGFVVAEYRRDEIASKVNPSDFQEYQAWKAAQATIAQQGAQPPPPNSPPAIPSPSLASAPSAGSILTEVAASEEDIFTGAIPKR